MSSSAFANGRSDRFTLLLAVGLLGSEIAINLREESTFYLVAVIIGGLYIVQRTAEVMWVGFFLLAVTAQIYPVEHDELGIAIRGAFRPYILVVIVLAASMFAGLFLRPRSAYGRFFSNSRNVRVQIAAVAGVLCLSLAHGYFTSASTPAFSDVLRECSGWIILLIFFLLGYWLSPSLAETQQAFARLRSAVLVYSVFFLAKFAYLATSLGSDQTAAGFGYSQRDAAFFSGIVLVLLVAQMLTSKDASWKRSWLEVAILLMAVLLCGSRSIVAAAGIVTLVLVVVWRSKIRLRWGLLGLAAMLGVLVISSWELPSQENSEGGLTGYVARRFLMTSGDDASLVARASEIVAVGEAVRANPWLGRGPFATYWFFDPIAGWKETTFVDSGLGYLLMKAGILGTVTFFWFAFGWLKMVRRLRELFPTATLSLACFSFYLAFLPFGPSFFAFQFSWFIGLVIGQSIFMVSSVPLRYWRPAAKFAPHGLVPSRVS